MGCSNLCSLKKRTSEVIICQENSNLHDEKTVKIVIIIQSWYRANKSRKKLKKLILNTIELKKKKMNLNEKFKQSWDLYFKTKYSFEFSSNGLDQLKIKVLGFYLHFFNKQEVMNHQKNYLIKEKRMFRVRSSEAFLQEFKLIFLPYLLNYFHLGNLELELVAFNIECQNIESDFISDANIRTEEKNNEKSLNSAIKTSREVKVSALSPVAVKLKPPNSETIYNMKMKSYISDKSSQSNELTSFIKKNSRQFPAQLNKTEDNEDRASLTLKLNTHYEKVKIFTEDKVSLCQILSEITKIESSKCERITMRDEETKIFYDGYWHNEKQCKYGKGYEYMIDGNKGVRFKYIGYYKDGNYHGLGMYSTEDGYAYFGEFRNNAKSGYGFEYTNNSSYQGFFHNGQYCGYGELKQNKVVYAGGFKNGLKDYFGMLHSEGEFVCCGQFLDGKLNGNGTFHWSSGHKYFGNWVNDKIDGVGEFSWKNGDRFIGTYSKDMKHGIGEYTFKNGGVLRGRWEFGKKQGLFKMTLPGGKLNETEIHYSNDIQL